MDQSYAFPVRATFFKKDTANTGSPAELVFPQLGNKRIAAGLGQVDCILHIEKNYPVQTKSHLVGFRVNLMAQTAGNSMSCKLLFHVYPY